MRHILRARFFVALSIFAILVAPPARSAQDSSALINEALDKPVKVELKTTLPNALREIKNRTGVPIELAPGVLDMLPWGDQTNLNVTVENQTLRQAIAAIARSLGLVHVLTPEAIELRPMPALQRLGRRATVDELKVLDLLASNPLNLDKQPKPTLTELLEAVDARLLQIDGNYMVERRDNNAVKDSQVIPVPRGATLADALDAITKETKLGWGPWGRSVLVKPKDAWVRDQLGKRITRRFVATDVGQVLSDLADFSGVELRFEPGALQRVPAQARTVTLDVENKPVGQVLETIAGFTGLICTADARGIFVGVPAGAGPGGSSQDPVFAMMTLPDSGIQVMIRQSELPDDLRQFLRDRKSKEFEKLRELMKEAGFKPATTQPSTTQKDEEPKDL
jgi:hypothetical protein